MTEKGIPQGSKLGPIFLDTNEILVINDKIILDIDDTSFK